MHLLSKKEVLALLAPGTQDGLYIDPLLDQKQQIGSVTIDLRLGCDFLVSIVTRKPYIGISRDDADFRAASSYFQVTRRSFGEKFVLYPNQVVLATTLEYVGLPTNVYADVISRSSYTRLGLHLNTMVQPGFRGCIPLELFNHSNNAIELVVGARIIQVRLFQLSEKRDYGIFQRKYHGNVRPIPSRAHEDSDISVLRRIHQP